MPIMHDTIGDATPNPTPRQPVTTGRTGESLPVATAAAALGITSDAVRARIRRGKLRGEKRGGAWFVFPPDADRPDTSPDSDATEHDSTTQRHDVEPDKEEPDTTPNATVVTPPVVDLAPLADVIRYQEEIIDRQSRELAQLNAAAAMWQERARIFEGQLKQLTAGETPPETVPEPPGSPESNETGPRGLLDRLRRWLSGS